MISTDSNRILYIKIDYNIYRENNLRRPVGGSPTVRLDTLPSCEQRYLIRLICSIQLWLQILNILFLKMGNPRPLFVYFRLFKQTLHFLQQIYVKKCPSSIQYWDSNTRPSRHESPSKTTGPGLPPKYVCLFRAD